MIYINDNTTDIYINKVKDFDDIYASGGTVNGYLQVTNKLSFTPLTFNISVPPLSDKNYFTFDFEFSAVTKGYSVYELHLSAGTEDVIYEKGILLRELEEESIFVVNNDPDDVYIVE